MKKQSKLIAVVCTLAMIFTMLGAFTVKAATVPSMKIEVTNATLPTKQGEKLTLKISYTGNGETPVQLVQGSLVYDKELFAYDAANSALSATFAAIGQLSEHPKNGPTFAATSANGVTSPNGEIATLTLKLNKDITVDTDATFTLKEYLMSFGDKDYEPGTANDLTVAQAQVKFEAPYNGPTMNIATSGTLPTQQGEKLTLKISYAGNGETPVQLVQGSLVYDKELFAYDAANSALSATFAAIGQLSEHPKNGPTFAATSANGVIAPEGEIATLTLTLNKNITVDTDATFTLKEYLMSFGDKDYEPGTANDLRNKPLNVTLKSKPVEPGKPVDPVITGITVAPESAIVKPGAIKSFVATVVGTDGNDDKGTVLPYNKEVEWKIKDKAGLKADTKLVQEGTTATLTIDANETIESIVLVATAKGKTSIQKEVKVTIEQPKSVEITTTPDKKPDGTTQFGITFAKGEKYNELKSEVFANTVTKITFLGTVKNADNVPVGYVTYELSATDFIAMIEGTATVIIPKVSITGGSQIDCGITDQNGNVK